jgi:uncharacterized phage protein gp47/JayE
MSDTWIQKDEAAIRDHIIAIGKKETGLTNFKQTGVLRGFLETIARVVIFIYQTAINPIYKNASLDDAMGFFLSLWGLALGVVRKQNSKTEGNFTGIAYGDGKIPAGVWVVIDGTELRYKTKVEVSFQADTTFAIPVIAEFAGGVYNIGAGSEIRLTRIISGLDSLSVTETWITSTGQDVEDDEAYRTRIKNRWQSQTLGDTSEVYRYYAESVNGVRSAHIIRTPRGPGTTDVIIASVDGIPGPELLDAVEQALYDHELMGFDVQVKAPSVISIMVSIEYRGDADEADVRLVVELYVHNLGIGGRFALRDLYALYEPLNLTTAEILSPDRDVETNETSVLTAVIQVTKIG